MFGGLAVAAANGNIPAIAPSSPVQAIAQRALRGEAKAAKKTAKKTAKKVGRVKKENKKTRDNRLDRRKGIAQGMLASGLSGDINNFNQFFGQ
jgi:hypothetical protein